MHRWIRLLVVATFTVLTEPGLQAAPPNVVVILADDVRWDDLGYTGHPFSKTPHIDRIAREGVTFENAFAVTPLCSPSRATILTGLYPHANGIIDNTDRSAASHELATFPRALQAAGYETAFVGKWHMGNDNSARPGFDHWACLKGQGTSFDAEMNINGVKTLTTGHVTDALTSEAVAFLKRRHEKPFLLFFAHKAVHPETVQRDDGSLSDPSASEFIPAKRHESLYVGEEIPRRPNAVAPTGKPALQREIDGLPPLGPETGSSADTILNRLRMLAGIDDSTGEVLAALEETGQLDNTVVIFLSDHGYFYGEHGLSVERRLAYEEALRIPMAVRYPSVAKAGEKRAQTVLTTDIAPTVLDLAGVTPQAELQGQSLRGLLESDGPPLRDAFLIEHTSDTVFPRVAGMGYRALRTDRWKLIQYSEFADMDEFYDLQKDPHELNNLISDPSAKKDLETAREGLRQLRLETGDAREEELNVAVPMRDGTVLRADVFRPAGAGPWPVLVLRTPYNKNGPRVAPYLKAGYMVVKQDARGRYASDGQWESFYRFDTHDAVDGYDTVEWAARLPGSNGKVGTFGVSYNAFLQWRLAALRPPSLVCMAAQSIPSSLTELEGPGTIRPGRRLNWFYAGMSPDMRAKTGREGTTTKAEAGALWKNGGNERLLYFLPWLELPKEVFEHEEDAVHAWLKEPHRDPWQFVAACKEVGVPNLDIVGWFDHCNSGIAMHQEMRRVGRTTEARDGQRLIIGPWSHTGRGRSKVGDVDFGKAAALDVAGEEIRWFDHWLKGKPNGVGKQSPVRIFVMGLNQWRDEAEWPPVRAVQRAFHLHSGGQANTPAGDGALMTEAPSDGTDTYDYDPRDPVPTLWSPQLFTLPADQAPLAERKDILVYQTAPLDEAMEVTGYPEMILHAASSAPDTDFFVKLIDVAPDGTNRDIASGMARARYRNWLDRPKLLTPGEVAEYRIQLRPTSNVFLPGHRIRVDITSSDFPNYDRNHNTAADPNADATLEVATQTIHHGKAYPSRIVLPVIPSTAAR